MFDAVKISPSINCKGQLLSLEQPIVMGILNITPDSFYDGGRYQHVDNALKQCETMLDEGAAIIDIGAMSSRQGAEISNPDEETVKVEKLLIELFKRFPQAIISVDTLHSKVAKVALETGASMINDISAGRFDDQMSKVVAQYKAPFIAMHMQQLPRNMQDAPQYNNVLTEVLDFFIERLHFLRQKGIADIIIDPGFGFGKTVEHNYMLFNNLHLFTEIGCPVLTGISRKSMIWKVLQTSPSKALNGSTALHFAALLSGSKLLRVHDVKEAVECIKLFDAYNSVGKQ